MAGGDPMVDRRRAPIRKPRQGSLRDALRSDPALAREGPRSSGGHGDDCRRHVRSGEPAGAPVPRVYLSIPKVKPEYSSRWLVAIQEVG